MSMPGIKLSAVMPCLNEVRSLGICIEKAQRAFAQLGIAGEVVVADNGSTDGSVALAQARGARVIHVSRKGYGAALMAGIEASHGDYIIMADADDSYDWSNLAPFIAKLDEGYELVIGNRFAGGIMPGAMPKLNYYIGNPLLSSIARLAFFVRIRDFHCGMRGFTKEAYKRMQPRTPGMEFATEMVAAARRCRLKIAEVPIVLHQDKRGREPHLRPFRDGWRHVRYIAAHAPLWSFFMPALSLALGAAMHESAARWLVACALSLTIMGVIARYRIAHPLGQVPGWLQRIMRYYHFESWLLAGAALCVPWLFIPDTPMPALFAVGVHVAFGALLLRLYMEDANG